MVSEREDVVVTDGLRATGCWSWKAYRGGAIHRYLPRARHVLEPVPRSRPMVRPRAHSWYAENCNAASGARCLEDLSAFHPDLFRARFCLCYSRNDHLTAADRKRLDRLFVRKACPRLRVAW